MPLLEPHHSFPPTPLFALAPSPSCTELSKEAGERQSQPGQRVMESYPNSLETHLFIYSLPLLCPPPPKWRLRTVQYWTI